MHKRRISRSRTTPEKEDTWKFDEVEVLLVVILSCDIQILDNLFTPKCFRKGCLVLNLVAQAKNEQFIW